VEKSVAFLKNQNGEAIEAELWDDIADDHLEAWRATWLPLIKTAKKLLEEKNVPKEKWPQDLHWKWDQKADWSRRYLSLRRFAITCEGSLQGLMLVNLTKLTGRVPCQEGKDLAYIEFVSTAPWNRPELTEEPIFRGVGLNMVRIAVELSDAEGFRGRVGLHSLRQSTRFYRAACGMTDVGPDAAYHDLVYFEMTEAQAAAFRAKKVK
jgi:hypothetical protein